MNDDGYGLKYAYIYTVLITIILLAPLFFYTVHMKNLYGVQNELHLKNQSYLVVQMMQEHTQDDEYFEYPRFQTFKSGLYDYQQKPIFSLIEKPIKYFLEGYHVDDKDAYLITKLPAGKYFGADYLVIKNRLSYFEVYEKSMFILLSIAILVFALSFLFLNRFAKPFKQVNKKLDNFIKDSIHEINTPLSIINVNIDLYNRKHTPNKYLQRMKAAAKVLSNIYNDMDYLIKYDRLDFEKESINMAEFLQERIDYFLEVAQMKNITLSSNIKNNISLYMNTKQFQRVIDNNISNAIKYSYEKSTIEVNLFVQDGICFLSFKDYGIGIEDVDKIFNRYYRESNQTGGFGIGLNIVKSIIDKAGIELTIDSMPKRGSTFTYKFPTTIVTLN
ncbi:HAMP domain-containing histidine kinase [Candidatus Sulfurimonas baltica]|uniref:histidine kinase n=2 Tax=Candidatus Sulfurimonas baltica TaxID=2740404 RepID=A0A7S7LUS5_9BACT|nr:HAMP domain-containing histidine kinase [Candidatus Sulfurimonas baltica]